MATGTAGSTARRTHLQVVETICIDVNFNDAGIASGVNSGKVLPAGAIIVGSDVFITTTFNAQTTNVLTAGTNGTTATNIVAAGDVDETTYGLTKNISPTAAALGKLASDLPIWVKYTQTGTAATQGAGTIIVKYVANIN